MNCDPFTNDTARTDLDEAFSVSKSRILRSIPEDGTGMDLTLRTQRCASQNGHMWTNFTAITNLHAVFYVGERPYGDIRTELRIRMYYSCFMNHAYLSINSSANWQGRRRNGPKGRAILYIAQAEA